MTLSTYRRLLGLAGLRRTLWLGLAVRTPMWAAGVVLTLHVVQRLGRGYTAAGVLTTVYTVAMAINGPWRGRMLDRLGLRRTLTPVVVVQAACWSVAPFVQYPVLLPLVGLAGLYVVPAFSLVRQLTIAASPVADRTSALALDAVALEISFMIGPVLGVLAATLWGTAAALLVCQLVAVAAAAALWVADPPLTGAEDLSDEAPAAPSTGSGATGRRFEWLTWPVVLLFAVSAATTLLLTGSDLSTVAALRDMGRAAWIGAVLAVWGAGSAVGGLVYGALHRPIPAAWLLAALGLVTLPVALAPGPAQFAALLGVAGLFCAPTLTAAVDQLSRSVPPARRGEAMGWHSSALTVGSALGAPVAGLAIDRSGWQGALVLTAVLALVVAAAATATRAVPGRTRAAAGSAPAPRPGGPAGRPPDRS